MGWLNPKTYIKKLQQSDNFGAVLLAVIVGMAGGVGAIFFRYLIDWADELFFSPFDLTGGSVSLLIIFIPALGFLIVNFMVQKWAPEASGHGVPEVMFAVRKRGGRIRPRVAVVKALASAICIGSGGSVGREGPIVQIGSTFGSALGQILKLNERQTRLFLACGAAAAIGGTFNAPIAGVIFALEVILGRFTGRSFGMIVISSVMATVVCQSVLGKAPAFELQKIFVVEHILEYPLYLGMGIFCGFVALFYMKTFNFFEETFEHWKAHMGVKALVGGALDGCHRLYRNQLSGGTLSLWCGI